MISPLITPDRLYQILNDANLILLDVSPASTAEGKVSDYAGSYIPGSRLFNLKKHFSDPDAQFPNTLPRESAFELSCQKLGVNQNSKIVVYDNFGIYSSPRVWWMFKTMGHEEVYVLDGGLPAWINAGFETTTEGSSAYATGNFKAFFQKQYLKLYDDVVENVDRADFTIVDARSKGRFEGTAPEPRKWLKSGSIPHSVNVPYEDVLSDGKYKSKDELEYLFVSKISDNKDLVFSCGSGLTACIVMLAYEISGGSSGMVYDGSWTEWAELQGLKVEE